MSSEVVLRTVPEELRQRYLAEGWWTDDTLGALVERSLAEAPTTAIRVWSDTRPWQGTYASVAADAHAMVAGLRRAGIEPGAVVAFQLPNWHEAVVAFYALAMGGYVVVPIVHIYGHKEVRFILSQSGAAAYVSAGSFGHVDYTAIVDAAAADLPDLRVHVVVADDDPAEAPGSIERLTWAELVDGGDGPAGEQSPPAVTAADPDAVVVLAYTSGTTSDPKGVVHTHRTLLAELLHMAPWITPGQANLMGSPVTHATGMLGAVLAPMQAGQPIHLIDRWDPDRALSIMLAADIGAGTGASVFLASLLFHPDFTADHAARMHRIGLGGAPVPVALAEHAASLDIAIIRAYGSTEHPSITGSTFDHPQDKRHRTDGPPLLGVDVRLCDDDGVEVPRGSPGEIFSRGPDLCMGYTDATLTEACFDPDGWYRTGDMGVLDAEGFLTITDRVSDIIIRGGENISAAEVEGAIASMPGVAEVAVVAAPDVRLGEHACAIVRLVDPSGELTLAQLTAQLEGAGMARQKWPEELRVVADFPRTGTGKIRKVDLRAQLRSEG